MLRNRRTTTSLTLACILGIVPACSSGGRISDQLFQEPPIHMSATLIFPPDGKQIATYLPNDRDRKWITAEKIPWEMTKSESAGRTRISAVRYNGNITEYYTSSSGPNGSTGRRRVTSRSTNIPHGHRHRP